jgi:hypothetical protein
VSNADPTLSPAARVRLLYDRAEQQRIEAEQDGHDSEPKESTTSAVRIKPPKLADIPGLRKARDIEPCWTIQTVASFCTCDERTIRRMLIAGKLPKPDFYIGTGTRRSPRWRRQTIEVWAAESAKR